MFRRFDHRAGHYCLLLATSALLLLPNLGAASLWDIDEGNNAEAAREMLESGNWVVPTFNFVLRVDKPALLYWLQVAAYRAFGVNEFAARLPSALAAMIAVLLTYELGRRLFDASAALFAGVALASSLMFSAAGHFANPDSLLNACNVLTFFAFWRAFERPRLHWWLLGGLSTGLAMLAKGPVGLVLPGAVVVLFLLWTRRLTWLCDRRFVWSTLVFLLVSMPWYALVGVETKWQFLRGFFLTHHAGRFLNPMENHGGPVYYYPITLLLGFAPWSIFIGATCWYSIRELGGGDRFSFGLNQSGPNQPDRLEIGRHVQAHAFLWCWIAVYLVFFSVSSTKLPNYILPVYPPIAILTARFLNRWRQGEIHPVGWAMPVSLSFLGLIGVGVTVGLLIAGGAIPLPALHAKELPGLERWAFLGLIPFIGAALAWRWSWQQQRSRVAIAVAITAVTFTSALAALGAQTINVVKAPKAVAEDFHLRQTDRDIRIACHRYFQPSLVFYCRRGVERIDEEDKAIAFLNDAWPVYLLMPAKVWTEVEPKVPTPHRLLGQHWDLFRKCDVVVVTNQVEFSKGTVAKR